MSQTVLLSIKVFIPRWKDYLVLGTIMVVLSSRYSFLSPLIDKQMGPLAVEVNLRSVVFLPPPQPWFGKLPGQRLVSLGQCACLFVLSARIGRIHSCVHPSRSRIISRRLMGVTSRGCVPPHPHRLSAYGIPDVISNRHSRLIERTHAAGQPISAFSLPRTFAASLSFSFRTRAHGTR